ncbi:uncharacterized protein LOC142495828 isoform X2 [Ascaphus truei]|uniref:uncharacterized protein LOC142495828 isoform X2 n=1 Tax=Ascaphus truei TaxID=8439 RepID=UPI003F59D670
MNHPRNLPARDKKPTDQTRVGTASGSPSVIDDLCSRTCRAAIKENNELTASQTMIHVSFASVPLMLQQNSRTSETGPTRTKLERKVTLPEPLERKGAILRAKVKSGPSKGLLDRGDSSKCLAGQPTHLACGGIISHKRQLIDPFGKQRNKIVKKKRVDLQLPKSKSSSANKSKTLQFKPQSACKMQPSYHPNSGLTRVTPSSSPFCPWGDMPWYKIPSSTPRNHKNGLFSQRFQSSLEEYKRQREIKQERKITEVPSAQVADALPRSARMQQNYKSSEKEECRGFEGGDTNENTFFPPSRKVKFCLEAFRKQLSRTQREERSTPSVDRCISFLNSSSCHDAPLNNGTSCFTEPPQSHKKSLCNKRKKSPTTNPPTTLLLETPHPNASSCRSPNTQDGITQGDLLDDSSEYTFPLDWSPPRIDFLYWNVPSVSKPESLNGAEETPLATGSPERPVQVDDGVTRENEGSEKTLLNSNENVQKELENAQTQISTEKITFPLNHFKEGDVGGESGEESCTESIVTIDFLPPAYSDTSISPDSTSESSNETPLHSETMYMNSDEEEDEILVTFESIFGIMNKSKPVSNEYDLRIQLGNSSETRIGSCSNIIPAANSYVNNLDNLLREKCQGFFLHRYSVRTEEFPSTHPGEEIFLSHLNQSSTFWTLDVTGIQPQHPLEQFFFSSCFTQQVSLIRDGFLSFLYGSAPCPQPVLRWLFQLLSSNSDISLDSFKALWDISMNILTKSEDAAEYLWCPSLQNVINIFESLNANLWALYPLQRLHADPMYKDSKLTQPGEPSGSTVVGEGTSPNTYYSTVLVKKLSNIFKFLTLCGFVRPCCYSDQELLIFIPILCRVSLDTNLRNQPREDLRQLLLTLLGNISDWQSQLRKLCLDLSQLSRHHHNLLSIVQLLPETIAKGRQLKKQLSLVIITKLLSKNVKSLPLDESLQLSLLFRFIKDMKPSNLKQQLEKERRAEDEQNDNQKEWHRDLDWEAYYLCHTLLTLANIIVGTEMIPSDRRGDLHRLCVQLDRHINSNIHENPSIMYHSKLKDLATYTHVRWQELLSHCTPQRRYCSCWDPCTSYDAPGSEDGGAEAL